MKKVIILLGMFVILSFNLALADVSGLDMKSTNLGNGRFKVELGVLCKSKQYSYLRVKMDEGIEFEEGSFYIDGINLNVIPTKNEGSLEFHKRLFVYPDIKIEYIINVSNLQPDKEYKVYNRMETKCYPIGQWKVLRFMKESDYEETLPNEFDEPYDQFEEK